MCSPVLFLCCTDVYNIVIISSNTVLFCMFLGYISIVLYVSFATFLRFVLSVDVCSDSCISLLPFILLLWIFSVCVCFLLSSEWYHIPPLESPLRLYKLGCRPSAFHLYWLDFQMAQKMIIHLFPPTAVYERFLSLLSCQ